MTVLLTGATGFLGSHLLKSLVSKGYKVVVLKRSTSDMWRLKGFENTFISYDIDQVPLQKVFQEQPIDTVIHTAWAGVASTDRDNWEVQIENFYFSKNLIDLSVLFNIKKIICEPTLKSKACLKCLYFTIIIFDLCRYLEYFSYLCTINQTE